MRAGACGCELEGVGASPVGPATCEAGWSASRDCGRARTCGVRKKNRVGEKNEDVDVLAERGEKKKLVCVLA